MAVGVESLSIDTAGTEEEAAEGLEADIEMEIGEEGEGEGEGEEGGGETLRTLEDLQFLNQESEHNGKTLIDARNRFNNLSRLEMLWTVQHCWTAGNTFNFYRHCAQLLLCQTGEPPVTILSREG